MLIMMMMAANRKQQSSVSLVSSSGCASSVIGGKSSNSSNETVIAAGIELPQCSASIIATKVGTANLLADKINESTIINETKSDCSEPNMLANNNSSIGDINHNHSKNKENAETNNLDDSQAESAAYKRNGKLKSFLLFTAHLNPFHHLAHHPKRKSSMDSYTNSNLTEQVGVKQQQRNHLNLFGFARRYFGASSWANNNLNQGESASKSAPVTPVKWQQLETEIRSNGYKRNSIDPVAKMESQLNESQRQGGDGGNNNNETAANLIREDEKHDEMKLAQVGKQAIGSSGSGGQLRPSVRFVESLNSSSGNISNSSDNDKEKMKRSGKWGRQKYADRAVQTSSEINIALALEQDEQDDDNPNEDELDEKNKELNIVARLFKLTESNEHQVSPEQQKGECPMDSERFRQYGCSLIDYISNYLDTIDKRRVTPLNIEPGYLKSLIQPDAPEKGESFANIMHDFENHIMCGITHWQHPHFHAYFPAGNAYPSILADMLSDALGCVGFSWAASPAYTELEIIMLDWMGKMIGLPDEFLCLSGGRSGQDSKGGGVIQGSASECVLVNLLAARHWAIDKLRKKYPNTADGLLLSKLIGYCSREAHSCVEKAAMIGFIRMRALDTDDKHSLRGETLSRAIVMDKANGLEPFLVCATLGTTSCVSFDNLEELGQVCKEQDIWLHVDAAYAGSALICPEFKYLMKGIEMVTSFNMNPNKWMLINFDCSLMWVKDRFKLTRAFVVDPLYLQHSFSDQAIDYRHWGIPLSRRFRALKLWFVIRNYGVEGLQAYIRNHVKLAKLFEQCIRQDSRFIITNEVVLGLVCFRLIGSNALNQRLLSMINASGKLHMVPASLNGRYVIRFCVCDQNAQEQDIRYAYQCISDTATELFESIRAGKERIRAISQQNTIDVSSLSLHTQQSASADRLNNMITGSGNSLTQEDQKTAIMGGSGATQQVATPTPQPVSASPREAARQYLMRRNSRHGATLAECGPFDSAHAQVTPISPRISPSANQGSSLSAKSPLMKQASISLQQQGEQYQAATAGADDEDLEQEIVLDSLATIDGYDYDLDLDDDDLLEPPYFDEPDATTESQLVTGDAADDKVVALDGRSPVTRRWHSRAGRSPRNQAAANGAGEQEEADDEVYTLAERRNRMSLRYKREFFVRVVSDPRVYRASISGDINAHASCCSLGGTQQPQPQTQQQRPNQKNQTSESCADSEQSRTVETVLGNKLTGQR